MLLKNKSVVISGVGPGMGQALARLCAAEGAQVVMGARNLDFIERVAQEIVQAGGQAVARATDVTDAAQCRALIDLCVEKFGKIDGLVNSAYAPGDGLPVETTDVDNFLKIVDVSCLGALRLVQAALPFMKQAGSGSLVSVSTLSLKAPIAGQAGYAVAKGALESLTRYMATELGPFGIRANVVRFGWMDGYSVRSVIDMQVAAGLAAEDVLAEITRRIPLGIVPPEEECAKSILYLLSDYSAMATGAVLDVNGGEYLA